MKPALTLSALILAIPLAAIASDHGGVLLMGDAEFNPAPGPHAGPTVSGHASAHFDAGNDNLRVEAAEISVDPATHQLKCTGGVTLHTATHTVKARDLTIDLDPDTKVFLFNSNGVRAGAR